MKETSSTWQSKYSKNQYNYEGWQVARISSYSKKAFDQIINIVHNDRILEIISTSKNSQGTFHVSLLKENSYFSF